MKNEPLDYLYIPIRQDLVREFYRRRNHWEDVNVAAYVEHIVEMELDGTDGDSDIWTNEDYLDEYWADKEKEQETREKYGSSDKGYQWKTLLLPNRTKLRMNYNGTDYYAEVRHEKIHYEEETLTPSQLASKIANNTTRNAWRDIFIQRPHEREWVLADTARKDKR